MKVRHTFFIILGFYVSMTDLALAATYRITPHDSLAQAVRKLNPGDTLLLADGVYKGSIAPIRSGTQDRPITIRAQHDGGAVIDGEYKKTTVWITRDWYVLEGMVFRNSKRTVCEIVKGSHNIIRRCTGYNGHPTGNSAVFGIAYPEAKYNLLEDCAASGTGRKMFIFFKSEHNTMRRCFANWQQWDGSYLNGTNLQFYGANHCTMENCIGYGPIPAWWSLNMFVQKNVESCIGNKILGCIVVRAGMNADGTPKDYKRPRGMTPKGFRPSGLHIGESGGRENRDCVFRDCFSFGNLGPGLSVGGIVKHLIVDHVTLKGSHPNLQIAKTAEVTITHSNIEGTTHKGEGARLTRRYLNGSLTDQPLWPWPMEDRIQKEMGISVTQEMTRLLGITIPKPTSRPRKAAETKPANRAAQPPTSRPAMPVEKIREAVIAGVKAGQHHTVLIDLAGSAVRGKIIAADKNGVTVRLGAMDVKLAWDRISPRRLQSIGVKYTDPR